MHPAERDPEILAIINEMVRNRADNLEAQEAVRRIHAEELWRYGDFKSFDEFCKAFEVPTSWVDELFLEGGKN